MPSNLNALNELNGLKKATGIQMCSFVNELTV